MMKNLIPWRRKTEHRSLAPSLQSDHPFAELQQRMHALLTDFFEGGNGMIRRGVPGDAALGLTTFDVAETDGAVEVRAELPGMEEKDIDVLLEDNILTIRGEKKQERTEKKKNYYLSECRYGEFHRAVPLPAGIDRRKVKAEFKKGVLRITLPKTETAQSPRHRIAIDAG